MKKLALFLMLLSSHCSAGGFNSPTNPLPGGATSYIQVTNSLQSGATFYVSSGTIGSGNFYVNSDPSLAVAPFPSTGTIFIYTPSQTTSAGVLNYNRPAGPLLPDLSIRVSSGPISAFQYNSLEIKGSASVGGCTSGLIYGGVCLSQTTGTSTFGTNTVSSETVTSKFSTTGTVNLSSAVLISGSSGTNGQVFTSGGAGAVPTWTTAVGGGIVSPGTFTWTNSYGINVSTIVVGNTFPLLSMSTLQAGSTFYVSSGTVSGSFNLLGTVNISTTIALSGSYGTNGQALTTNGSSSLPTWSSVPSLSSTQTWTGAQTFSSTITVVSIIGTGTPTISTGTGAGTIGSPTASISGKNMWGQVTVNSATTPATSATVAIITPSVAMPTKWICVLFPANAVTGLLSGASMVLVDGNASTWTITSGATGLTGASTYVWDFSCGGY